MLEKEISILRLCRHRNILEYLGLISDRELGGTLSIVYPHAENNSLPRYLRINKRADRLRILQEVAAGLSYLHAPRFDVEYGKNISIVHGDIHKRNVLIKSDGTPVLADFGLCKIYDNGGQTSLSFRANGALGLPVYLAPEVHNPVDLELATGSDIFAFSMLTYETFGGNAQQSLPQLHGRATDVTVAVALIRGDRPSRSGILRVDFTNKLWELVCECWQDDARARPEIIDVSTRLSSAV
ncbi:kinase-like protein [Auricularia subglabra TFB-10046 SS5]|nr:kinase-like protein [Auricularia subglabra TFB-10046 SS5]